MLPHVYTVTILGHDIIEKTKKTHSGQFPTGGPL